MHERYVGPRGVTVEAPLDRLPLFVRAGAMLPLGPAVQYHDERPLTDVTLLVYGGARSSFTLYEDDGTTRTYREGRYALTDFECASTERTLTVRIADPRGESAVLPPGRNYTLRMHSPRRPGRVRLTGIGELPERGHNSGPGWWREDGWFTCLRVPVQPAAAEIEW